MEASQEQRRRFSAAYLRTMDPWQAAREAGLKDGLRALRDKGVEHVIITLGSNGSAVVEAQGIRRIPCVKMSHVADPTAAGDSFVGALSVGLTIGLSLENALAFASHTAAITVSRMGAMPSLPSLAEVEALLKERGFQGFALSALDALRT